MGYQPHLFPVSVKGVVVRDGRVLLLRNERDEWELPGGKHREVGLFTEDEAAALPMPEGYKKSMAAWYAKLSTRVR
jgi:hypothetical protein